MYCGPFHGTDIPSTFLYAFRAPQNPTLWMLKMSRLHFWDTVSLIGSPLIGWNVALVGFDDNVDTQVLSVEIALLREVKEAIWTVFWRMRSSWATAKQTDACPNSLLVRKRIVDLSIGVNKDEDDIIWAI